MRCAMRTLGRTGTAVLLATLLPGQHDGSAPPPARLGVFFWHDSPNDEATWNGLRQGLAEARLAATFVERRAGGDRPRALAQLDELRAADCALVVALGTEAALLAKERLPDVPVVFAAVSNAVASGVVADWSGSGSNLCGASNWIDPAAVLETFQLAVPRLHKLGMLRSRASGVVSAAELTTMRERLQQPDAPKVTLVEAVAADADDLGRAVQELLAAGVDAIWIPVDLTVYQHTERVIEALGARPVPLLSTAATAVRKGALAGATVDYALHGRRAAGLVLDVLVRKKTPGSLPIDRMRGSCVLVNVAAARRLGRELPLSLLLLADELIDAEAGRAPGR